MKHNYLKSLKITQFRQFSNLDLTFNKSINIFIGVNRTGKSTLLSLIANSTQLNNAQKKEAQKTVFDQSFATTFREIMHADNRYDQDASEFMEIKINNDDTSYKMDFYWQEPDEKSGVRRYRFLTRQYEVKEYKEQTLWGEENISSKKRMNDKKAPYPVIYLGLSRLYPLGETALTNNNKQVLTNAEQELFIEYRMRIFGNESIQSLEHITKSTLKSKPTLLVKSSFYGPNTNSTGQDNLSQILIAIISLQRLLDTKEATLGILCIDEFDASMHPSAQKNLIDLFISIRKDHNIQLFITTHNVNLTNIYYNNGDVFHFLFDFDAENRSQVIIKPSMSPAIISQRVADKEIIPILVLVEDQEAEIFLNYLLPAHYSTLTKICCTKISCSMLKNMYHSSLKERVILVLDGDSKNNGTTICHLPMPHDFKPSESLINQFKDLGLNDNYHYQSPESIFYNYLLEIRNKHTHDIHQQANKASVSIENLLTITPKNGQKNREALKEWFNKHATQFKAIELYKHWINDHETEVKAFIESFEKAYKIVQKNSS